MATASHEDSVAGVRLSHPNKVIVPDSTATKLAVARYIETAAKRMLPHVGHRLLSLLRCSTDGKECFFQKHPQTTSSDFIRRMTIAETNGKKAEYLYIDDSAGLVAAVQLDTVELHIWGSSIEDIEKPDRIVFDLDPADDVAFGAVKTAAVEIRDALAALNLKSFPMISGGKGIHVIAPIAPAADWAMVKTATRALANRFAEEMPEHYLATASKARRDGRIFIDYLRNDRGATAVAPYSIRARSGAPIAWPMSWDQLGDVKSADAVRLETVERHFDDPDPWTGYAVIADRQSITPQTLKALGVPA